ncbi:MAG: hypothetical protein NVS1B13_06520 [Flavisolibacter sp.]
MSVGIKVMINYKNKVNLRGQYSVHLRLTVDRLQRYYEIKVPQKVTLSQWSGLDDQWVNHTHPYAFEINNKIIDSKKQITDIVKRYYNLNKPITMDIIDREFNRRGERNSFNDYVKNYIRTPPPNVRLTDITWEKYHAFMLHLDKFNPKIRFNQMDVDLIASFRNYLADLNGRKGKMHPATIKSYFDKFKVIAMHAARKENLIDVKDLEDYFREVKIHVPKRKEGQHLEIEELQKLRALSFNQTEYSLERDRDLF